MTDTLSLIAATPGCLAALEAAGLDATTLRQTLTEATRLAEDTLAPLAARADAQGCRVQAGRVVTPDGYGAAYRQLAEDGWLCADLAPDLGGLGLPLTLHIAASLAFEGAATPFMMQAGSSRAAAHLLAQAAPDLAQVWAPRLAAGDWTATICISEPDAGSDVGRIRTRATPQGDGWQITGTKCWISFADTDVAARIGHLALARTGTADEGTRGLSLFLVPNTDDSGAPNGITIERIEEKLGLHGSPTCVMRFDGAKGTLIGAPGRGLSVLFGMIERMRLQVACQGAGIALRCAGIARGYASERRQGGRPDAPPPSIDQHPDVARLLGRITARSQMLGLTMLEIAAQLDRSTTDPAEAELAALLLPLAKTFGGEWAFEVASDAMQVLGGAGYTREWPIERHLRDARILTIYEGTTGMQAQDFLFRRLLGTGAPGLAAWRARIRHDAPEAAGLLHRFDAILTHVARLPKEAQLAQADLVMRAGWGLMCGWMAGRLAAADAQVLWQEADESLLLAAHRLGLVARQAAEA